MEPLSPPPNALPTWCSACATLGLTINFIRALIEVGLQICIIPMLAAGFVANSPHAPVYPR
jgi:hypothetical protein